MVRIPARSLVPLMAVLLLVLGCDDDVPTQADPSTASLSVYLTDAPGDVEAVWLEITGMSLRGDAGDVTLLDGPTGLIEVTDLVGRAQEIVDDAPIPPGTYGSLNVLIGGAVLETRDGAVYTKDGAEHPDGVAATGDLKCPSCSQSGLKVKLHGVELDRGDDALVLDFDVSQSFGHPAGNSGMWVMRPVIHTDFERGGDDGEEIEAESIEGTVVLGEGVEISMCPAETERGLEAFIPVATAQTLLDDDGVPVARTGEVDDDGEFEIDFLSPDTYTLGYEESIEYDGWVLAFTATVEPDLVTVADEDVEGVVYTVTAASCEGTAGG